MDIAAIAARAPVIPVLTIDRPETAVPLARALVKGGLPVLEITLRTETAMQALELIAREVPEAIVGAGTVLNSQAARAGATGRGPLRRQPWLYDRTRRRGRHLGTALPAGRADDFRGHEVGRPRFQPPEVFPGRYRGRHWLVEGRGSALAGLRFCPTGGAGPETAPAYLALANVACVGGSWVAPKDAVSTGDWGRIERLAAAASALKDSSAQPRKVLQVKIQECGQPQ